MPRWEVKYGVSGSLFSDIQSDLFNPIIQIHAILEKHSRDNLQAYGVIMSMITGLFAQFMTMY